MDEQAREKLKQLLREKFEARLDAMAAEVGKFADDPGADTLYDMETNVNAILDQIGDEVATGIFRETIAKDAVQDGAIKAAQKNTGRTTGHGRPPSSSATERP